MSPKPTIGRITFSTLHWRRLIHPTEVSSCKNVWKRVQSKWNIHKFHLGGGNQGHLGLFSSVLTHECISPKVLYLTNLETSTTEITNHGQAYTNSLEISNAFSLIEHTIIEQISTTINEDCLANLIKMVPNSWKPGQDGVNRLKRPCGTRTDSYTWKSPILVNLLRW